MPTLTWLDSFQHQQTAPTFYGTGAGVYDTSVGGANMSFVTGRRSGSLAIQLAQDGVTSTRVGKLVAAGNRTVVESFYFKISVAPSVNSAMWQGLAVINNSISMDTTGHVFWSAGSGTVKTSSGTYADGVWHRIDVKWVTSASTYTLDIYIDGVSQIQQVSGSTTAGDITETRLGSTNAAHTLTVQVADWVRSVTSGDYPIGEHIVVPLIPNADGTHNWASTNMGDQTGGRLSSVTDLNTMVDDFASGAANTTDYIAYTNTTNTATEYAEIGMSGVGSGATVWAARAVAAIFAAGTTANAATTRIVDGSGTTVLDLYVGDQSDTSLRHQASLLPGIDTPSEVNALKWRVGFPTDSNPAPRWSALMVDIAVAGDGNGTATPAAVAGIGAVPTATAKGDGIASPATTAGVGAVPVLALLLAEQSGTVGANTPINGTGGVNESATQEFVLPQSAQLKQISLLLTKQGSPSDDIHITLWTGDPDDAHSLGTLSSVTASTVGVAQWVDFPFNIGLSGGTRYFIRLTRDNTFDATNRLIWGRTLSNPLPTLDRWTLDNGVWSRLTDADQTFRVYGSPLVVASAIASAQGCQGIGAVPAATASGATPAAPVAVAGVGTVPAPTASGNATASPGAVAGVGAVPAPTGKGDGATSIPASALGVSNTGEGGVQGNTVDVTNSDDDGQGSAWDVVTPGASSTITYDDHGAIGKSIKIVKASTDNDVLEWGATLVDGDTQYGRMYVLFDAWPATVSQCIVQYRTAGGTQQGRILIGASQTFVLQDATGTVQATSSVTLSLGTLYRLEWKYVRNASGSWELRIYAGHSTTPLETLNPTGINTGAATTQVVRYGVLLGAVNTFTVWQKWFNANQTDFPGPAITGTTQVVGIGAVPAATASGAANGTATPSTVVGTGAVPAPTASGAASASPAAVAGVGAVPAPTANGNSTASPAATAGVGAVPAPTATGNGTATPAATAGVGTVPVPTALGGGTPTATPSQVAGIGAVPAPTAKGDGSTSVPATAPGISNTGEGGNSGATVSTTNSDDDGQGTAWDAVAVAATSTVTYDDHGAIARSIKIAKATGDTNTLDWNATLPNGTTQYGRMYLLFDVAPASQAQILVNYRNNADTSAVGSIRLTTAPKLVLTNSSGTTVATSAMTFATGTLYRLEWKFVADTTVGSWEVRIYAGHSTTVLETLNPTAINTSTTAGIVRIGTNGTQTGAFTYWAKWFNTNQTAFPGPAIGGTTTVQGVGAVPAATAISATNGTATPAAVAGIGAVPAATAKVNVTALPAVTVGVGSVPAPTATGSAFAAPVATVGIGLVPATTASGPATALPAQVVGTGLVPAATGTVGVTASPGAVAGIGAVPAPTASGTGVASPAATAGVGAVPAPPVAGVATALPAAVAGIGAVPGPTAKGNATALPAATVGTGSVPPATAKGNATALPAATAGVGSVPAPTGSVFVTASPAATVGVGSVPAPTAMGIAVASPARTVGIGLVPAPTAKGNATASPAVTVGVGSVPAPTASGTVSATATPARVAGVGSVPAPAVTGNASAHPQGRVDPFTGEFSEEFGELQDAPTQALGSVPAPTITGTSNATPDVVAGTVVGSGAFDGGFDGNYDTGVFPDAIAHGNATASPGRVAGVGSVPSATAPSGATALPAVTAGVGSVPSPTARGAAFASPPAVVGIGSVPPVVASGVAFARPSVTAGIGSVPAATANGGAAAIGLPGSVAGVGTVPAPAGSGSATASPTPVAGVGAVPAPTIAGGATAQPAATAGIGAVPPSTAKGNATAAPAATVGVGAVPPVTAFARATALPAATAGVGSVPAPVASGAAFASPGAVPGIGSVPVTTAAGGSIGTATPAGVAGIGSVPAPVASGLAAAAPIATAGTGSVPPATATGSSTAQPASTAGVGSVPAPTATGTAFASPAATAGIGSVPPSTAVATAKATPAVNAGVGSVPAPTATGGASSTASPAAVAGVGSVPAASASGGAVAKPAAISGVGSVPPATAYGAATATSAAVAGVGSVPPTSSESEARAFPAAVAGVGFVPPVTGHGTATASPATVSAIGTVPAPSAFGGVASTATPVSVAGIGSVPAPTAAVTIRAFPPRVAGFGTVPASTQTGDGRALPIAAFAIGLIPTPEVIGANANTATPTVVEGIGRVPAPNAHGQGPPQPQHDYEPGHHPSPIVGTPRPGWRGQPVGAGISASANGGASGSGNARRYTGRADPEGSA